MNASDHNANRISDWVWSCLDAVLQGLLELAAHLVSGLLDLAGGL